MKLENSPVKILVVDDVRLNVRILERELSQQGYQVLSATNGADARTMAVEHHPDLILLDIVMPGESGFDTIRKLKENANVGNIPIIFITGDDTVTSKVEGFELGAVDYITKPFQMEEVLARVRLHLRLSIATNALITSQAARLNQVQVGQNALLIQPEDLRQARFGVVYEALHEAGGDFYDVIQIAEHIFGYFLADVSGHDLSTAFVTASVKALLKQNCKPVYQPEESMKLLNSVLCEILPPEKYITACYIMHNRSTRSLSLVNMAHPPVLYLPADGDPELIELESDILGAFPNPIFASKTLKVNDGDRFFIYSDGLVERARENMVWSEGMRHLIDNAVDLSKVPIMEATASLSERLKKILGEADDDIVVLGFEV